MRLPVGTFRRTHSRAFPNRGGAQIGADVRYAVSPETTVIATLNPDFAEAQVDAQQINLTPYTLFKPEKRAFFLEGSNQFTFASGIGSIFIPFYSRSIGLVDGTPIRIDDGIKLVGQEGPWSIRCAGCACGRFGRQRSGRSFRRTTGV